jgi:hypothetical protein
MDNVQKKYRNDVWWLWSVMTMQGEMIDNSYVIQAIYTG